MTIEYKKDNEWVVQTTEVIIVADSDENQYRISQDKFGGIEILAEDGPASIEPRVSNQLTIKTLN